MSTRSERPPKILVVDDLATVRQRYATLLHNEGYDVATAPDGETALGLAKRTVFDLLLLDLNLPGINGIDVVRALRTTYASMRELFELQDIPVLLISGYVTDETVTTAHFLGVARVMEKPVDQRDLLETVREILEGGPVSTGGRKKAVVLDARGAFRALFRHVLEGLEWTVIEIERADRIGWYLRGSVPDVIVVGVEPPLEASLDMLQQVRELSHNVHLIAIAEDQASRAHIQEALPGAVVLTKPLDVEHLVEALAQVSPAQPAESAPARPTPQPAPASP